MWENEQCLGEVFDRLSPRSRLAGQGMSGDYSGNLGTGQQGRISFASDIS